MGREERCDLHGRARGGGRCHAKDADHADHAQDGQQSTIDESTLLGAAHQGRKEEPKARRQHDHPSRDQSDRERVAPPDAKDEPRGDEEHDHLSGEHHVCGGDPASEDVPYRRRRGEHTGQRASLLFHEQALRRRRAAEEDVENDHAGHDCADDCQTKISRWRAFGGRRTHVEQSGWCLLAVPCRSPMPMRHTAARAPGSVRGRTRHHVLPTAARPPCRRSCCRCNSPPGFGRLSGRCWGRG